jgi:hypothetical protein
MSQISQPEWNELEAAAPDDQISFRGERLFIDGIHITSWDCPQCLKQDNSRCVRCSFFDPVSCRLRYDPELRCDLKSILDDYRERLAARRARKRRFVSNLRAELRAHGRPLHYTVLAQIMADRHPELRPTESKVRTILAYFPEIFEKTDEGVYQVRAR